MHDTSLWMGLIPVVVPLLIELAKKFMPKLPSATWPVLAPLLGAAAEITMHYAGVGTLNPAWGALLGSAGVGLRELHDQLSQLAQTPPKQ